MPGTFRIRKWLDPPVGLADSPCGACRHCFAMPGVLSAFPYSRFARIPSPDARLMTQSLRSEGISASRTSPSKLSSHPESVQFSRTSPSNPFSHPESAQFSRTAPPNPPSHPEIPRDSRTAPPNSAFPSGILSLSPDGLARFPALASDDAVASLRRGLEMLEGMTIGRDFDV